MLSIEIVDKGEPAEDQLDETLDRLANMGDAADLLLDEIAEQIGHYDLNHPDTLTRAISDGVAFGSEKPSYVRVLESELDLDAVADRLVHWLVEGA